MSQSTIDLKFADGDYTFALPIAQINELQRKTGVGIGGLFARVLKGTMHVADPAGGPGEIILLPGQAEFYALDLIETIRHGLIGGGKGVVNGEEIAVTPVLATKLIDAHVTGRPLKEAWDIAVSVLTVCVMGFDPPKKDEPAKERAPEADEATATSATS